MQRKALLPCVVLVAMVLTLMPLCVAQQNVTVNGYTDQPYYKPGDSGTLHFWVYDKGTADLILENLTIYYPWDPAGMWETNQTVIPSTSTVITANGGNWSDNVSFTVPNDGRATGGQIEIYVTTDKVSGYSSIPISVTSVPTYLSLENMNQLTLLLTVIAVLMIICTAIIAYAILLVARRRRATAPTGQQNP
jgi:uncharacterized membrane protein